MEGDGWVCTGSTLSATTEPLVPAHTSPYDQHKLPAIPLMGVTHQPLHRLASSEPLEEIEVMLPYPLSDQRSGGRTSI
jgi:hypothetical protein